MNHATTSPSPELEHADCPMGCSAADEPALDGRDRQYVAEHTFHVVRCRHCQLLRTNPRPTSLGMPAFYPATYAPHSASTAMVRSSSPSLLTRAKIALQLDGTRDLVPRAAHPGRALEVGCADGRFLEKLRARGFEGFGVEPSDRAASAARERGFNVWTGGLETCPGFERSFDLIVASHAFEHLHQPVESFRKLRSWAKPNAWLACSVPDAGSLAARAFGSAWYDLDLPRHLFHFTQQTLSALLALAGWRVVQIHRQRTLNSWTGSMANVCFERSGPTSKLGRLLLGCTRSALFRNVAWPVATATAALGQSGRFVVWAQAD